MIADHHDGARIDVAREFVRKLAPQFSGEELRRAVGGSSKIVWFLGEAHILRFPLHRLARNQMEVERRILTRCRGKLGLSTPIPVTVDQDRGVDICLKALGRALDLEEWEAFSESEKAAVALPFADFLARLHREVSAEEALTLGVPEYVAPEISWLRGELAGRLDTPARRRLLDLVCAARPALMASGSPRVLLHNDFSHHNIGFDQGSNRPVGVFDFGSAFVGDLHRDLRYDPGLDKRDDTVVDAYEEATGVTISRPRQRAWHAFSALENLAYSLRHEGTEMQATRWGWVDSVASWDLGFFDAL